MASSDDEVEAHPQSLSNYYFVDDKDVPVSFSVLPIQWSESENIDGKNEEVFLHGVADNGLRKVFMQVTAWKFDISNEKPVIAVLSKDRRWIKLLKPRKSFEDTIRTTLITVHFLHYVVKNPETSAKSVWDYLSKVLSYYEVRPSQNDLSNHLPLIGEAVGRNAILAKSKLLLMVLEKQGNVEVSDEETNNLARPSFIVDNIDDYTIDEAAEESDEDDDLFDSVCVFCDNGGKLLCCDGKCLRSFHATEEDGAESFCDALGLTLKEVDEIQNFYCKNCEYNQHQCFVCGKLGSSGTSLGAEVYRCDNATCGRFYHPHCVAKLLQPESELAAKKLEKNIAGGEKFTCPIHFCCICKQRENKKEHELQFAMCRRCPKSYHRKCLPREIAFEDLEEENILTRAWEGLLPCNRILIYCLKHEIDDELGTPIRDHIRFPKVKFTVQENNSSLEEETKASMQDRVISNSNVDLDDSSCKRTIPKVSKVTEKTSSGKVGIKKKPERIISGSNISRKRKANDTPGGHLNEKKKSISKGTEKLDGEERQSSLGKKLYAFMTKSSEKIEPGNHDDNVANKTLKPTKKELSCTLPKLDADSERRILDLFKEAASSITLDNVLEKRRVASTHTNSLRNVVEKTITAGKLEGSVDAVRTALRKLDKGQSIEDSEAVCDPDVLNQIFKWRDKLKVYLAPVLYGNRYTSYGRHFTQVEKLEGIVDRLHWYVQNGDTIVDFCCGANDFSILMKKKLEGTGKKCFYKNYDLLPTKNDFNFEMRDWTTVQLKELPRGSQLIMGLNPPFGVKANLANKFIEKALEFQPKLLILIVPPGTQRLDEKSPPYNLVWKDDEFLSGKSFYLPGSVDVYDRQMEQWNVRPPPLYLWSRHDWTDRHKAIAQEHGHMPSQHDASTERSSDAEVSPADHTMEGNHDNLMLSHDHLRPDEDPEGGRASRDEGQKEFSSQDNVDNENQVAQEQSISNSDKTSRKRKHDENQVAQERSISNSNRTSWKRKRAEENDGKGHDVVSKTNEQAVNNMYDGAHPHSQSNLFDGRSSVEGFRSKHIISPSHVEEVSDNAYRRYEPSTCSRVEYGTAYGGTQDWPSVTTTLSDYGARNFEEQHSSLPGGGIGSFGYRPYTMEEGNYWGEMDIRQQIRIYGMQEPDYLRSSYSSGDNPAYGPMGTSYGQLGSDSRSSYMNTSAMQRYAPRLDESNHMRMRTLGSEPPTIGRNGNFERGVPPQPGYGRGPQGFTPGPYHAYSRRNSGGWLNE